MRKYISILFAFLLLSSCVKEEITSSDSNTGNFEALWQIMDQHYCFFDYKKQTIGVDWNEIHDRYAAMITNNMTTYQLFEVLCNMIGELRDGHVNLIATHDIGRNWSYYEDYERNYSETLIESYLGKGNDYMFASSLKYRILKDNIGYVRCESFASGIGEGNLSLMFDYLKGCNGIILDVRDNGGGSLDNCERLAARFTNEKNLIGYLQHKKGKQHNDFSKPEPTYIEPAKGVRWQKPVAVLTNRACFSATNHFIQCVKQFKNVTVIGDKTGGGSGLPFNQELPNGWGVRFSAVVLLDANKQHTEFGIEPDIYASLNKDDEIRGIDTIIETARQFINNNQRVK